MKYARFEDLPVWQAAIDLARRAYELTALEAFRRHPGLRDQLERAALSVSNNIAEGFERGSTNELLAFLYIARGSAGEVRSMLCVLEGMTAFSNLRSQITDLKGKAERISKQLHGWIEQLKDSGITGQRHLNAQSRARMTSQKDGAGFLAELQRIRETSLKRDPPQSDI